MPSLVGGALEQLNVDDSIRKQMQKETEVPGAAVYSV